MKGKIDFRAPVIIILTIILIIMCCLYFKDDDNGVEGKINFNFSEETGKSK